MKLSRFLLPAVLITSTLAVWSCSKSNNGKPTISIASITTNIPKGGSLDINLKFNSSNSLDSLTVLRIRINQAPPQNPLSGDTLQLDIPEYSASKGELEYVQPFTYLSFGDNADDSLVFKFVVLDVNKKHSDTLTSPMVIVHNL